MPKPLELSDPVTALNGVGEKLAPKLINMGLSRIGDLLFHLPYKYQDRTRIQPMGQLRAGSAVVIQGEVRQTNVQFGKRRSMTCTVQDGSGILTLRFFHFTKAQQMALSHGLPIRCYGEVRLGPMGLEMAHPEYQTKANGQFDPLEQTLTPLYPTSDGINQPRLAKLVAQAVDLLVKNGVSEWLPSAYLTTEKGDLPSLKKALITLHRPKQEDDVYALLDGEHPAQERLAIEELLAHHLSLQAMREATRKVGTYSLPPSKQLVHALRSYLPFELTNAQERVFGEISADLNQTAPMLRLVQGDVGSGKTVVAMLAALQAIEAGYQVALMAPTELLAEQHAANMLSWCKPLGVKVALLLGKTTKRQREPILASLASGDTQLVIGTHALFQNGVDYHDLGLVIIDEQHRFGVAQRLALTQKAKRQSVHQLTMTATPIPRTLAMTAFADLDISIIDELPPGRTPVLTTVLSQDRREAVINRVDAACDDGRQIYWVCTLIEDSQELQAEAAEVTAQTLSEALPNRRIGLLHGKLKSAEKSTLMNAFKQGELDILVATTVIEVGVDVPNASVMIIENPERLGLAQLHQLRGRVGRGTAESYCLLLFSSPLSEQGKRRLEVMRTTNDGFVIAEEDLKLRGPGEVLGTRQTGAIGFKVADIEKHAHLLEFIPALAAKLSQEYPAHIKPIIQRWLQKADQFAQV